MDIPSYIAELLDEQDYVVIPGIGALLASYRPAEFNRDKNLLLPPSRVIAFYPEMKSNDGILTGIMAHDQKIPLSQASRLLEKFTGDLLFRIEKGEKTALGSLGQFSMEEGEVRFSPGHDSLLFPDAYGLSPLSIHEPALHSGETMTFKQERKKFRMPVWAMTGLFFLLTGIPLLIWLILSPGNNGEPGAQKQTVSTSLPETAPVPPVMTDTADQTPTLVQPVTTAQDSVAPLFTHPRKELYYTIGGSFKSETNAKEYFGKMSTKGFHPIHLGRVDNFYLVALDTFYTPNEAFKAADQYAPVHRNTEIWVYHLK